jgi:hypothetical protein
LTYEAERGSKKIARSSRRLRNEKLNNNYSFSDTISVTKSSMTKGAGFIARLEIMRNTYAYSCETPGLWMDAIHLLISTL